LSITFELLLNFFPLLTLTHPRPYDLRNHRLAKNCRQADNQEGSTGVTVVELDL